jgi:hypothetical protein
VGGVISATLPDPLTITLARFTGSFPGDWAMRALLKASGARFMRTLDRTGWCVPIADLSDVIARLDAAGYAIELVEGAANLASGADEPEATGSHYGRGLDRSGPNDPDLYTGHTTRREVAEAVPNG